MKNLHNLLIVLAIFSMSNIIASEGQSDMEVNPFLRKYKAIDESKDIEKSSNEINDNDENDGNYGFYYGNKDLRNIYKKYVANTASYDNKTIMERTNKVISNKQYEQLQKIGNSVLAINDYLNRLYSLNVNIAVLEDTKNIISNITKNYLSNDVTKNMLDTIQALYESPETSDNDKSKLFEIFNNIKEIRNVINKYITNAITINDYAPPAIDSYNNKINNNINNIQNILTQLTLQIADEFIGISETLRNVLKNIIPNINNLMDKYCKAADLVGVYQEQSNEEIANYFRRIALNIENVIQLIGFYFQSV